MKHTETRRFGLASRWLMSLAVAVGLLTFSAVPRAHADDDCQKRVAHADHRLHEAVEHHGAQSPEAEHARAELHEARQYCWDHNHRWWDEDQHRWHDQQDWDDHDHDNWHH